MAQSGCEDISHPEGDPTRARPTVGEDGGEKGHYVRAFGVANGLNVRVLIKVHPRAYRDSLREIFRVSRSTNANQRFRIGTHELSKLGTNAGQKAFRPELEKEFHGSQSRCGEHNATRRKALRLL